MKTKLNSTTNNIIRASFTRLGAIAAALVLLATLGLSTASAGTHQEVIGGALGRALFVGAQQGTFKSLITIGQFQDANGMWHREQREVLVIGRGTNTTDRSAVVVLVNDDLLYVDGRFVPSPPPTMPNLDGPWTATTPEGNKIPCSIKPSGSGPNLILSADGRGSSTGEIKSSSEITGWGGQTGKVSADGRTIKWSLGVVWEKN